MSPTVKVVLEVWRVLARDVAAEMAEGLVSMPRKVACGYLRARSVVMEPGPQPGGLVGGGGEVEEMKMKMEGWVGWDVKRGILDGGCDT